MNILFRCDGSVDLGMGHVSRCIALAETLNKKYSCNIIFAMRRSKLGVEIVQKLFSVILPRSNNFNYAEWLINIINKKNIDILVLDVRDGLERGQLNRLKKETRIKIVTIDDPEEKRLEADLAFYPPIPQLSDINWNGFKGQLYSGFEYLILRKEFIRVYPKSNNSISRLLVSMGGTDQHDITNFIINILNKVNHKMYVDIIVGEGYPYIDKLKYSLQNVSYEYSLHHNPSNMAKLMFKSNLALVSFGVTAYELIRCEVPILLLGISNDHLVSASTLVEAGCAISLGLYKTITEKKIIININNLLKNPDKLYSMSDACKQLIDGNGTNRIAEIVIN